MTQPIDQLSIDDPMLTTNQTSALTGIAKGTLEYWRWEKRGPSFLKLGRAVRYRKSEVIAWMNSGAVQTTEAV